MKKCIYVHRVVYINSSGTSVENPKIKNRLENLGVDGGSY